MDVEAAALIGETIRDTVGRYRVQDRAAKQEILAQQKVNPSDACDDRCAVEAGRLLQVRFLVSSTIRNFEGTTYLSVRLTDVESGEVVGTARDSCECSLKQAVALAERVTGACARPPDGERACRGGRAPYLRAGAAAPARGAERALQRLAHGDGGERGPTPFACRLSARECPHLWHPGGASAVRNMSGHYNDSSWSARQALGPLNGFPRYGDPANIWATPGTNGEAFIELAFPDQGPVAELWVMETYGTGGTRRIWAIEHDGRAALPATPPR